MEQSVNPILHLRRAVLDAIGNADLSKARVPQLADLLTMALTDAAIRHVLVECAHPGAERREAWMAEYPSRPGWFLRQRSREALDGFRLAGTEVRTFLPGDYTEDISEAATFLTRDAIEPMFGLPTLVTITIDRTQRGPQ